MRFGPRFDLAVFAVFFLGLMQMLACEEEEGETKSNEEIIDFGLNDQGEQGDAGVEIGDDMGPADLSNSGDAMDGAWLTASESYELPLEFGWVIAALPTEARYRELLNHEIAVLSMVSNESLSFDQDEVTAELNGELHRSLIVDESSLLDNNLLNNIYNLLEEKRVGELPLYIHCRTRNKAAAVWALYLHQRLGYAPEQALNAGLEAGLTAYQSSVEAILGL